MLHFRDFLDTLKKIPVSIWAISLATLFMSGSSLIIFSLMPDYLTKVLGISIKDLGIIEGLIEAVSWLTRIGSGILSDMFARRKLLMGIAYGLICVSRLIFPVFSTLHWIGFGRFMDRFGNGLQATPREALISDIASQSERGTFFGLRETMGKTGSFLTALILLVMFSVYGINYQRAFQVALLFSCVAFLCIFFIHDPVKHKKRPHRPTFSFRILWELPRGYWGIISVSFVYMCSNISGAFLILRMGEIGLKTSSASLVMIIQNLATLLVALPIGWMSDRLNRKFFLQVGCVCGMVSNLLLISNWGVIVGFLGVAFWGAQMGIMHSMLVSKISDTAPAQFRGTCFGLYYFVSALGLLSANIIAGDLGDLYGLGSAFQWSLGAFVTTFLCLSVLPRKKRPMHH